MTRLVLFDIDGTLVRGGPAKTSFEIALREVYGATGPFDDVSFAGKTDPQIARELMRGFGVGDDMIERGLPALFARYLEELRDRLPEHPVEILPGVQELVTLLEEESDVAVGLVTGNVVEGARLKLRSAGLDHLCRVGGFGSDHEHRNELPGIAMRRAAAHWGVSFRSEAVVVVGDTPRDVECGRHHGTRTVAVATGHFGVQALTEAGADHVIPHFGDTTRVLELLLG